MHTDDNLQVLRFDTSETRLSQMLSAKELTVAQKVTKDRYKIFCVVLAFGPPKIHLDITSGRP